ncbi:Uncharacterised protein [Vibrio cholerae]|nr:Uncharacterised protein [Vibrio cholerae]CSD00762.1 Uncharacterised protein [Vibrio cholerae]
MRGDWQAQLNHLLSRVSQTFPLVGAIFGFAAQPAQRDTTHAVSKYEFATSPVTPPAPKTACQP